MAKRGDRVELKGSARAALPGGQDVGPSDPNQQIEATLFLRRGSKAGEFPLAAQMGARLPRERKYLTREEFARLHGASPMLRDHPAHVESVRPLADISLSEVMATLPGKKRRMAPRRKARDGNHSTAGNCWSDPRKGTGLKRKRWPHQPGPFAKHGANGRKKLLSYLHPAPAKNDV